MKNLSKYSSFIVIACFVALYLCFFSNNPSIDAWAYAYNAKEGIDLFSPHHLLYTWFCSKILNIFAFLHIEPILLLQGMNTLVFAIELIIVRQILKNLKKSETSIASSLIFLGGCWGVMRFAIDNECYTLPTFFTLCAIYAFQSFTMREKEYKVCIMALFLVLGCLFHQIVILAWLCFFVVLCLAKNKKHLLLFTLVSLLIPLIYWIVFYSISGESSIYSLMNFVLTDYANASAEPPNLKTILMLSPISLARTFVQMHGYMLNLFKTCPILISAIVVSCITLAVWGIRKIKKNNQEQDLSDKHFTKTLWWLAILCILFACISNGNAEFMNLLPFVTVILFNTYYHTFSLPIALATMLWNVCFGLLPYHSKTLNNDRKILDFVAENKNEIFYLQNKPKIENMFLYYYGNPTPQLYNSQKTDAKTLKGKEVFTDRNSKLSISRSALLKKDEKPKTINSKSIVFHSFSEETILQKEKF